MYLKGEICGLEAFANVFGIDDIRVTAVRIGDRIVKIENGDEVLFPDNPPCYLFGRECAVPAEIKDGKATAKLANFKDWIEVPHYALLPDKNLEAFLSGNRLVFSVHYTVADVQETVSDRLGEQRRPDADLAAKIGDELTEYGSLYEKIEDCIEQEMLWQIDEKQKTQGVQPA